MKGVHFKRGGYFFFVISITSAAIETISVRSIDKSGMRKLSYRIFEF